jgi:hypothetical protein
MTTPGETPVCEACGATPLTASIVDGLCEDCRSDGWSFCPYCGVPFQTYYSATMCTKCRKERWP